MKLIDIIKRDYYRNFGREIKVIDFFFSKKCRFFITFRILQKMYKKNRVNIFYKVVRKMIYVYNQKLQFQFKIEISPGTEIGYGLYLPHLQNIVINVYTKIGNNCTILQDVTMGNNNFKGLNELPIIEDKVTIGAGAKIIGPVIIAEGSMVGANSVIVKSFFDKNSIIAGNPARLVRIEKEAYVHNNYDLKFY